MKRMTCSSGWHFWRPEKCQPTDKMADSYMTSQSDSPLDSYKLLLSKSDLLVVELINWTSFVILFNINITLISFTSQNSLYVSIVNKNGSEMEFASILNTKYQYQTHQHFQIFNLSVIQGDWKFTDCFKTVFNKKLKVQLVITFYDNFLLYLD